MSLHAKATPVEDPRTGEKTWTVVDADGLPFPEIDDYLGYLVVLERSPNTVRAYAHDLSLYCRYLDSIEKDLYEISPQSLGYFINFLRKPAGNVVVIAAHEAVRSEASVNRALAAVAGLYDFLEKRDGLAVASRLRVAVRYRGRNLRTVIDGVGNAAAVRRERTTIGPRLKVPQRRLRYLTIPQARSVIDCTTNTRDQLLLTLLLVTGMRIGQALGLRHSDIDVPGLAIEIVPRDTNAIDARSKNKGANALPVTREVARLYMRYMSDDYGLIDSDFVFINVWGGDRGAPMTYSAVASMVGRLRVSADLPGHWSLHTLRHTFAMAHLKHGVPIEVISAMLTHKSAVTTSETYARYEVDDLRQKLQDAGMWESEQ